MSHLWSYNEPILSRLASAIQSKKNSFVGEAGNVFEISDLAMRLDNELSEINFSSHQE